MNIVNESQKFILPGTGLIVTIFDHNEEYMIKFIKEYGYDMITCKPHNMNWRDYYLWVNLWLNDATTQQINMLNREDLKLIWNKFKITKMNINTNTNTSLSEWLSERGFVLDSIAANWAVMTDRTDILKLLSLRNVYPSKVY